MVTNCINYPYYRIGLKVLCCNINKITLLPELPYGLKKLRCAYTELSKLPILPNGLEELWCDNKVKEIPLLPKTLSVFTTCIRPSHATLHNRKLLLQLKSGIEEFSNISLDPCLINAIIEEVIWVMMLMSYADNTTLSIQQVISVILINCSSYNLSRKCRHNSVTF